MIKRTLTIGIPAYNEEANIRDLLTSLLEQKNHSFSITKIIVSSDGSTDKTVERVKSLRSSLVKVVINNDRKGIARGLNQIISNTKSDILVTLDADITIKDRYFLEKLIFPIVYSEADLTSSAITERPAKTFYEKVIYVSMIIKNILFETFKNGNNVYTCHGLARAYSSRFYKTLRFPVSIGNDMYSYLKCINGNFNYNYVNNATAWYKLPQNHSDHKKQSTRFFTTLTTQKKYFDPTFIQKETKIPQKDYLMAFVKSIPTILTFPIHSLAYFVIQFYMRLNTPQSSQEEAWTIATSTKHE